MRTRLQVRELTRRTVDQRLLLRFPRLAAAYVRLIGRLSPSSSMRQVAVRRGVRLGVEAYNRRDLDAAVTGWRPGFQYRPAREWVDEGLVEPCYYGVEGYVAYAEIADRIAGGEMYLRSVELIDLGDRLLILADAPVRARAGASRTDPYAALTSLRNGAVVRVQEFFDHKEALEAVGLQ